MEEVKERFGSHGNSNPVDEFKNVKQITTVDDYIKRFERARASLVARIRSLKDDEKFHLLGFFNGLKDEIVDALEIQNPTTLKQAFKVATQIEKSQASQEKKTKWMPKTPQFQPSKLIKGKE